MKEQIISIRIPGDLNARINAEVGARRKEHHGWYDKPTRSSVIREMLERDLDRIDRVRATQTEADL